MAAALKAVKKMKIDYNINRAIYDTFIKKCTQKGYAPHIIVERLMKKYSETGQI